jgi:Putative Actinobacterial Holin-X, holin superfamily III
MPTPGAERSNGGIRGAVRRVSDHASAVAKLELELASLELKKKATSIGIGIGLAVGAALVAFFMVAFLLATIAAGLATFLPTWLALLIVTLFLGLLAAALVLVGRNRIQKGSPLTPERAMLEAKLTSEALRR